VGWPNVLSVTFGGEGEWFTVETAPPRRVYGGLHAAALESGVVEMYSPDENLSRSSATWWRG